MPFPGSIVSAPVMASRQGLKDLAFGAVSDRAQPVVRAVTGALTGKGSGLQQPTTVAQGAAQAQMQQAAQQPGQAISIGKGQFWPAGAGAAATEGSMPDGSMPGGSMPGGSMPGGSMPDGGAIARQAQSLIGGAAGGMSTPSVSALGAAAIAGSSHVGSGVTAAAMAASGLGRAGTGAASVGSISTVAAAAAQSAAGMGQPSLSGVLPGMKPGAPQFTALPTIPSMTRLQDVAARLGAVAKRTTSPLLSKVGLPSGIGGSDDGAITPASQFAGGDTTGSRPPEAGSV